MRFFTHFLWINVLFLFSLAAKEIHLSTLSLEEKVGQLLLVHTFGETAGDDARLLIQEAHVGGIIYFQFANGLTSPAQVQTLSASLQALASIPLFIAIDQEGAITHLKHGFTYFPSNWALGCIHGRTGNREYAEAVAQASGEELKAVGINFNLAPVVDVNTNPLNPVIGIRSFSSNPETVALLAKKALTGYKQAGIIAALKHFPGHGDTAIDSHHGLPTVTRSKEALNTVELFPFNVLAKHTPAILTAHVMMPALDPDHCATFSSLILERELRKVFGFQGVVISDSLLMEGALKQAGSLEEAAVRAFNAGCDILSIAGGFERKTLGDAASILNVHKHLVSAVKAGRISEAKLNASVARILELKKKYGLFTQKPLSSATIAAHVNTPSHQALAKTLAKESVALLANTLPSSFSFAEKKIGFIAPEKIRTEVSQIDLSASPFFFKNFQPTAAEIEAAKHFADTVDLLFVFTCNAWKFQNQIDLIKAVSSKPVIAVIVGSEQDQHVLPPCAAVVASYGPAPVSLSAAIHLFK